MSFSVVCQGPIQYCCKPLRVAFAYRLGVVMETKHSSHMDHGGLFEGPGEYYDACNAKHATHRLEDRAIETCDGNKTNAPTIAEWTDGSRFVIRRQA
jgi:hypothetical protein